MMSGTADEPAQELRQSDLVIHIDESPVGVGKTYRAIHRALKYPARWLFAVERIEAIEELQERIERAGTSDSRPRIIAIRSGRSGKQQSVRQQLEALPSQYAYASHMIVICTHACLLMSDLHEFHGWHLVIDEVPNILNLEKVSSKLDDGFFQTHFTLTPVLDRWSKVGLTEAGRKITGSDLAQDDSHKHFRIFHRLVVESERNAQRHVLCNLTDWKEMGQSNLSWTWWSLFSASELQAFASVRCLGNGFMKSFTAKLISQWDPSVVWKPYSDHGERKIMRRRVSVRCFSERRSSKSFFETEKGESALDEIGRHIAANVPQDQLIWSSNESFAPSLERHLGRQSRLSPKQAGSDQWMHFTNAAMIYAAKPSQHVREVLACLGMSDEEWTISNEQEVILQFVTRTSIRDVASEKHAVVYVFDRTQADYLMEFFETQPHIEADCERIDLNLDLSRNKSGPKPKSLTPEEIEARGAKRRAEKAASARRMRAQRKAA